MDFTFASSYCRQLTFQIYKGCKINLVYHHRPDSGNKQLSLSKYSFAWMQLTPNCVGLSMSLQGSTFLIECPLSQQPINGFLAKHLFKQVHPHTDRAKLQVGVPSNEANPQYKSNREMVTASFNLYLNSLKPAFMIDILQMVLDNICNSFVLQDNGKEKEELQWNLQVYDIPCASCTMSCF